MITPRAFHLLLPLLCVGCASILPVPSGPLIEWDHYHRYDEISDYLHYVTRRHSDKARLKTIGRSRQGRHIYAVEINNPRTGPAAEKPGFYIDGNIHGGEVLAGEGALHLIDQLLERYEHDDSIRRLVDTRAFYIVPIVNPDGRVISVSTPENHRWNAARVDLDSDGRFNEDPPEDLDLDGRILRMRVRNPEGRWKISPTDARLMVRRGIREQGGEYYHVYSEGIDNDDDGLFNEDRVGGIDLNRNFPANWSATQYASGPFPLSEPESRALVKYITANQNIAAIHTFHTSGGMILRFPTLADQDWDFPEADLEDYAEIGQEGASITGYDNYARDKKTIVDLMHPGHGVFNDWGSKVFGVFAITTEMWKHPFSEIEEIKWNDAALAGKGFIDWYPYEHPQLGDIELGGWDRWSTSSPPEHLIEEELRRNSRWVLTFAERLPQMTIRGVQVNQDTDSTLRIEVEFENTGWMATATAQARDVLRSAQPVRASIKLENAELVDDQEPQSFGVLPGKRAGVAGRLLKAQWRVRILDIGKPASAEVIISSQKAGTDRLTLDLPVTGVE